MAKDAYRIRNWPHYNKSLVRRGSITFWFSEEIVDSWKQKGKGNCHGNQKYSNTLIVGALTLGQLFHLPLRNTQGLLQSLSELMNLSVDTPHYSTLSRRGKTLKVHLGNYDTTEPKHVLIDSTGIQVIGEGQWKTSKHGKSRHQVWRKLHITMDEKEQRILSAEMTDSVRADGNYLPGLLDKIAGPIDQVTGDGAYDKKNCYRSVYKRGAKAVFPPQHDAIVQRNKIKKDPALSQRDKAIEFIGNGEDKKEKRALWKKENNYHRRSLVETMMWRMKALFGDQMRARDFDNQKAALLLRCAAINKINSLGLPVSEIA